MNFSNLVSAGLGLFGAFSSTKGSREKQSFYDEQASINKAIGAFNAEVAVRSGNASVSAIAQMTRRLVGEQRALFAGRGITLEGSPMMIIGDTITMGAKKAQEAYFNSEVEATNARYNMLSTVSKANSLASESKYNTISNTVGMARQLMSMSEISKYKESTGVEPTYNIFKFWK